MASVAEVGWWQRSCRWRQEWSWGEWVRWQWMHFLMECSHWVEVAEHVGHTWSADR